MGISVFPKPNNTNALIPFVQQLEQIHSRRFTYVVADAGYDSHENLTWLKNNNYLSNFLGISYILKELQLECGKTPFCYSPILSYMY